VLHDFCSPIGKEGKKPRTVEGGGEGKRVKHQGQKALRNTEKNEIGERNVAWGRGKKEWGEAKPSVKRKGERHPAPGGLNRNRKRVGAKREKTKRGEGTNMTPTLITVTEKEGKTGGGEAAGGAR